MGQSSGLPTSFTQRPYNYPDLFVSVVEFCIAGIVAAILNFFFQRPGARRVKPVKSVISTVPVEGARVVPQAPAAPAQLAPVQLAVTGATSPAAARVPPVKADPVTPPAASVNPATPVLLVGPAPVSKPGAVASSAPPIADSAVKPVPSAPKAEPPKLVPAKPKKPKEVYYNIVGEPVSSDED
jgi:hypothetical protein